ncbi:Wzz/FepE/Etk N-terminal domain-containing protein [Neolewinella antarctica]|uniref:Uncharacterized protein involved in exopolysaccharide biosynthesis n=1 Tax=Neolewinella antarctica TaxID=442734 RepID=A0ABX0XEQ7_9BACT|nr:Wzz/FepE/Etk N-terminal domain-containing protein [Neolewinella antarctica]NJC27805.1 uncharacterized protein involved in exopolysaccharide biosynthesis [Neolewinella antarctica]
MNTNKPVTPPPPHLLGVLRSLWQWRKPILVTTLVGTVLALVISLLLPVYYQASTSFIALSPDQNSLEGLFGRSNNRVNVYGNGDDIDRLLAIAESDQLVDHLVDAFHLNTVYDIDSTAVKAPVRVRREFLDNYDISKSARDVIELSVSDRDPVRASEMARVAREKVNDVSVAIIRATHDRTAKSLRAEVKNREGVLENINARLEELRSTSGIYNTTAQGEALSTLSSSLNSDISRTRGKIASYRERNGRGARDSIYRLEISLAGLVSSRGVLDSQLVQLNESIGPLDGLEEERHRLNAELSSDQIRLKQYEALLSTNQRSLETVEEARVPVVKSKPVRSLIVLGGMFFSFLAAVIGALLIGSARRYDWDAIYR